MSGKRTKVIKVTEAVTVSPKLSELQATKAQDPVPPTDTMLSIVKAVIENPGMDITRIQAAIDMRNNELRRLAQISFAESFVEMADKLPLIAKTHYNEHTKSYFAKLENINEEIKPVLNKYGFGIFASITTQTIDSITVKATLLHKQGHSEFTTLTLPLDTTGPSGNTNKSKVHGTTSSISYAKRVAICALLNISTGEDTDGVILDENGKPIKKKTSQSFQEKVNADSKKNPSKPEEKAEVWNGKDVILPDGKRTIDFENAIAAAQFLYDEMKKIPNKESRLKTITLNQSLINALIKIKRADIIESMHKLASKGA